MNRPSSFGSPLDNDLRGVFGTSPSGSLKPDTAQASNLRREALSLSLSNILQIAFEAAIFPNRFELDEQQPHSRWQALTEELLHGANHISSNDVACKAVTISIIKEVSERVQASILRAQPDCRTSIRSCEDLSKASTLTREHTDREPLKDLMRSGIK
jgi:hypothetical protein